MPTEVMNLMTGEETLYFQAPHKAVMLAHRQLTEKNFNWWDKGYFDVEVEEGERCVTCGDWTALKEE